ncbi:MAG: sodium:proton antiporter [Nitrospiraceae bacterium]|nr:sodium:proton antiporter [Nitrospiraceae bacterium]
MPFSFSFSSESLGAALPVWSVIPFLGLLVSMAVMPLAAPKFWHDHFGKVSALWGFLAFAPLVVLYGGQALGSFLDMIINEYLPFIILLGALYAISGGILITGNQRGTPGSNTVMLLIGTLLASFMGTTGAAMLLIRPLIRANAHRQNRTLVVIFFIFLVANIGGALTPFGDPPLFLGFLSGVPFFWTFRLLPHMFLAAGALLLVYYLLDRRIFKSEECAEGKGPLRAGQAGQKPFRVRGAQNFVFLLVAIGALIAAGQMSLGRVSFLGAQRDVSEILRDIVVFLMALCSMLFTAREIRDENGFTWFPLKEVAVIFAGLFVSMTPLLDILQAGAAGHFGFLMRVVNRPSHYFWAAGTLSSFLDNAPAYLAFFKAALGSFYAGMGGRRAAALLIMQHPAYLEAVSAGSVFFGAFTYIGNAPNFMVRSIAEESGVEMPGFLGYMLKFSLLILLPLFILETLIFFSY